MSRKKLDSRGAENLSEADTINLFTIGFTQKGAEVFFETLVQAGVQRIIDARLNNSSQLAGFAKQRDLEYFLKKIGGIDYVHILDLAPTKDILDDYKNKRINWEGYEARFIALMIDRAVENKVSPEVLQGGCLLCSEAKPDQCHRRLVAEYFQDRLATQVSIHHL